jgi:hypothetical protein
MIACINKLEECRLQRTSINPHVESSSHLEVDGATT